MVKMFNGILLSVLTLVLLSACSESSVEKVEGKKTGEVAEQKESTKAAVASKVGETIKFDGLMITVNSVRVNAGDDMFKPVNDKFVVVDVVIENTTDKSVSISSLMQTSLVDTEGYKADVTIIGDAKGSLDGEVGPGRKLAGEVAFDVKNSEKYEFIFEDPLTSGQAIWEFEAK